MHSMSLRILSEWIHAHCGINYMDNLLLLESKVARRLCELGITLPEYMEYINRHKEEWVPLVECITINETYFFREEAQLNELCNVILPEWKQRPRIRIWSAACSTGEEPYSIAMMIAEQGHIPLERVSITGTDINRKVLQFARQGCYPKQSLCFRRTSSEMLNSYFHLEGDKYQVNERIRNQVEFRPLNLVQDIGKMERVDIIFCRNVLIYFDEETTRRIIGHFYDRLNPGGYLFLGHAETILGINTDFETVNAPNTYYYRKKEGSTRRII